jgi:hypothetical protein
MLNLKQMKSDYSNLKSLVTTDINKTFEEISNLITNECGNKIEEVADNYLFIYHLLVD